MGFKVGKYGLQHNVSEPDLCQVDSYFSRYQYEYQATCMSNGVSNSCSSVYLSNNSCLSVLDIIEYQCT